MASTSTASEFPSADHAPTLQKKPGKRERPWWPDFRIKTQIFDSSKPKSVALSRKQDPSKKLEEEARKKAAKAREVRISSGSTESDDGFGFRSSATNRCMGTDGELLDSAVSGDISCQAQKLRTAQDSLT